jgi:hypothetical protein
MRRCVWFLCACETPGQAVASHSHRAAELALQEHYVETAQEHICRQLTYYICAW